MEGRRHSKVRQSLRERLMREHTDRRIEERRKSNKDDMVAKDCKDGQKGENHG